MSQLQAVAVAHNAAVLLQEETSLAVQQPPVLSALEGNDEFLNLIIIIIINIYFGLKVHIKIIRNIKVQKNTT